MCKLLVRCLNIYRFLFVFYISLLYLYRICLITSNKSKGLVDRTGDCLNLPGNRISRYNSTNCGIDFCSENHLFILGAYGHNYRNYNDGTNPYDNVFDSSLIFYYTANHYKRQQYLLLFLKFFQYFQNSPIFTRFRTITKIFLEIFMDKEKMVLTTE